MALPAMVQTVAYTIYRQLGSNRFVLMTGAKHFVESFNSLSFALPRGFAIQGINHVRIELMSNDTYSIKFGKNHGVRYVSIREVDGIYADDLQAVFTKYTGLDTHL